MGPSSPGPWLFSAEVYQRLRGKWPSRLHELAVFRECLHLSRGWEELPEIDHYDACFNLICDWAGIKMATAREMKLGLVVALGNLPCMGLFNGMVHKGLQTSENYQRAHGVPELRDRNINNAIIPEQWMSVMMDDYQGPLQAKKKKLVYEAFISDGAFDLTRIDEPPRETPIPMYQVVGVWYPTADNDPSIGAELAKSWSEEHLAVLM